MENIGISSSPELKEGRENRLDIGEVHLGRGLEDYFEKGEFESEVQNMSREIDKYLGENKNSATYNFAIFSSREEYENYLKTNFPVKPGKDYLENDMYCIYDGKSNRYFIGKFMDPEIHEDDQKVQEYLKKTKITFNELREQAEQDKQRYKNNIFPTIAHEMTHTHSFFKGADYKESGNKWAQEMVCVFIDQKMWEKYTKPFFDYGKMTQAKAREQVRGKDLYEEITKDFEIGDFNVEDWERFVYQFMENRFGKEKLKEFWNVLSERGSEANLELCFEEVFQEKLKDVMGLFQKEIMRERDLDK